MGTRNVAREYKHPDFQAAEVTATIKSLKYTTSGDMEMVVTIPYECRTEGQKFADAWGLEMKLRGERLVYDEEAVAS